MAAPQVVGTPAAASTPEVAVTAGSHGIDAVLGDLTVEEPAAAAVEEVEEGAAEEGDAAEETPAKTPEQQPGLDDLLFSDEALATADGVKKAVGRLRELRVKQHEAYLGLKGYEKHVKGKAEKLKAKVASFRSEKQTHDLLLSNVRSNLQGLHSGDPDVILTALGNLTGTDGVKAYELLTSRIVNRGASKLDPQVQALLDQQQAQIEELRGQTQQQHLHARATQVQQQIQGHAQRIGGMIQASTTTPRLTQLFAEKPQQLTDHIINAITEDNGATPAHELFAQMEAELERLGVAAPQGTNGGTVQQPKRAQRSPGQSVGPRTAAAATPRVPTEEESLKALADDQDLMRSLGFG